MSLLAVEQQQRNSGAAAAMSPKTEGNRCRFLPSRMSP